MFSKSIFTSTAFLGAGAGRGSAFRLLRVQASGAADAGWRRRLPFSSSLSGANGDGSVRDSTTR